MKTDNRMVFILISFLAVAAHCTNSQSTTSGYGDNHVEPSDRLTAVEGDDRQATSESSAVASAVTVTGSRSARQYYQPAAAFAYQPYPQRRAYKVVPVQKQKKRPLRAKPVRRPAGRPGPRPRHQVQSAQQPMQMGRYRRLPPPVRAQQINYVDSPAFDYDDGGIEQGGPQQQHMSFDYGEREFDGEQFVYAPPTRTAMAGPVAVFQASSAGRSRKRPAVIGYAADEPQAVVHVPVRVARPVQVLPTVVAAATAEPSTTVDPMDKLKQLVHEAMDEHFANRHQELYADGFEKKQQVFSAKYKRQPGGVGVAGARSSSDKQQQQQRAFDVAKSSVVEQPSSAKRDAYSDPPPSDDPSDDHLTLAEISAYMGAKPAETVLSAGGHRYVLSDALQQTYGRQLQQQKQQHQQQQQEYVGEDSHHDQHQYQQQYLRYVSPFEALYELPAARWTYK